ncbi:MAG TPA: energy transducer TonB [Candidatus Synoicihabitans sp.]|nr:energy transducer TonB [Candidatus Synoicihabitans sp.]
MKRLLAFVAASLGSLSLTAADKPAQPSNEHIPAELRKAQPTVKFLPKPIHPSELADVEGKAVVEFTVSPTGNIEDVVVLEATHPAFGEAAKTAVQQAVFHPGTYEGRPVSARISVPVNFKLPKKDAQKPKDAAKAKSNR